MPIIGFAILVQILCAVHCVRNGRSGLWLTVIIFLSLPGCLAYAVFEILPEYTGRRGVRAAKAAAVRKLDPDRNVRSARDALELADTPANRIALGDALMEQDAFAEAALEYERALGRAPMGDRATQLKLARAELEAGAAPKARQLLETLPPSGSASETDRANLLRARALEACGETELALRLYSEVAERMAGGEAKCRQAALLLAESRRSEARTVLEDVERLLKRLDRFQRGEDAQMYDWAERTLTELRSEQA